MVGLLQQERHTRTGEERGSQHRDYGCAPGRPGQALAAGRGQGRSARHDDQVSERGDHVTGQQAQPEHCLGDRVQRQFEGVIRRVADDPAVQQEMAVEDVPPLQRVVRPVGVHPEAERDPQQEGEQSDTAADPHRRLPPAAHRRTPDGSLLAGRGRDLPRLRRCSSRTYQVGPTRMRLPGIHTWTILRTRHEVSRPRFSHGDQPGGGIFAHPGASRRPVRVVRSRLRRR